ncbi:hypothetical protein ACPF8X_18795 [Streptomyces sp. G35A]
MRSARMVLATATATAALAIAAPAAYADHSDDGGHDKSSYSKEDESSHSKKDDSQSKEEESYSKEDESQSKEEESYGKEEESYGKEDESQSKEEESYGKEDESYGKEHEKDSKHDKPHGGMHTGGGALAAVNEEDWGNAKDPKYDPETYKDKGESQGEESYGGKDKEWKHEKPRGGMHTGGGALAEPGVTAGGLAALAVLGTGAYALRRKKASGSVA